MTILLPLVAISLKDAMSVAAAAKAAAVAAVAEATHGAAKELKECAD